MFVFNRNNILSVQYCYILLSTTVAHLSSLSFTGESDMHMLVIQDTTTYWSVQPLMQLEIHHLPPRRDSIYQDQHVNNVITLLAIQQHAIYKRGNNSHKIQMKHVQTSHNGRNINDAHVHVMSFYIHYMLEQFYTGRSQPIAKQRRRVWLVETEHRSKTTRDYLVCYCVYWYIAKFQEQISIFIVGSPQ